MLKFRLGILLIGAAFFASRALAGWGRAAAAVDLRDPNRHALVHHGLTPPLLTNHWDKGAEFWSFGAKTVVSNTYVRLTPANNGGGNGYLWNRQSLGVPSFRVQFSLSISEAVHQSLFRSTECPACGFGFWLTNNPTKHNGHSFYGVPSDFRGIGLVVLPDGSLFILQGDETQNFGSGHKAEIEAVAKGTCSIATGQKAADIVVDYSGETKTLTVWTAPAVQDARHTHCAVVNAVEMPNAPFMGFTAHTAPSQPIAFDISFARVTSLQSESALQEAEKDLLDAVEFDATIDKRSREYWDNREDEAP